MFINDIHKVSFRIFQFAISFVILAFLSACGGNSANTQPNKSIIAVPTVLQKFTLNGGVLKAFVILDGDVNNPIPMVIDAAGEGTASVFIPGLSREPHNVLITYEYTDDVGTVTLATILNRVDLTQGPFELNVLAGDYDLNSYDENQDGINNAEELVAGTDFRLRRGQLEAIFISSVPPELSADLLANGELRAFVVLDGNTDAPFDMQIDPETGLMSLTMNNLTPSEHVFEVIFEYIDNIGNKLELAIINQAVNLIASGANFDFDINNLVLTDFDGDGLSNLTELQINTDPRISAQPQNAAVARLSYDQNKIFRFTWADVSDATYYRLLENRDGKSDFIAFEKDIQPNTETIDLIVPVYARFNTSYIFQSCNAAGCSDDGVIPVDVSTAVQSSIYVKSDGSLGSSDVQFEGTFFNFGADVSLSADGKTLAVLRTSSNIFLFTQIDNEWVQQDIIGSQFFEVSDISLSADGRVLAIGNSGDDSDAVGINGDRQNTLATDAGAVDIYVRINNRWVEQAYIKASNTGAGDNFGANVSLSDDGLSLVVSAHLEDSAELGVKGLLQADDSAIDAGAVYYFRFDELNGWGQQAYLKSSNTGSGDLFGSGVSLSGDGLTLSVGAMSEDSAEKGTAGLLQSDNNALNSGAVYIYRLDNAGIWIREAYLKASNTEAADLFGFRVSINETGSTLAVTAAGEDSGFINNPDDNSVDGSDAVYVFSRGLDNTWSQAAYLKPGNIQASGGVGTTNGSSFGGFISLSGDGLTLAVGDLLENSDSILDETNKNHRSGAAYTFVFKNDNWVQQAHIKASNPDTDDFFGRVSINRDGSTLAVGAHGERGSSTVINGFQNNVGNNVGAVYLY